MKCEKCRGTGGVRVICQPDGHEEDTTCLRCNGTGVSPRVACYVCEGLMAASTALPAICTQCRTRLNLPPAQVSASRCS